MNKEEIKETLLFDLEQAWKHPFQARYWLERLPKTEEYDVAVEELINVLEWTIKRQYRESFEMRIEELVEHYFINIKDYEDLQK